jgi:predicted amidohydrolase
VVAAVVQLNSGENRARNLARAEELVRRAAGHGAALVVLPEKFNRLGRPEFVARNAEPLDGPTITWARELARELAIDLVAGSILELRPGARPANASVHVRPDGEIGAVYRKVHLFDVDVGGASYRESDTEAPGDEAVVSKLVDGTKLGLAICYDLRFPELFRELALRGAEVIALPAAFTVPTGRAHWQVLLRARAIENQVFVLAAGQVGEHPPGLASYGHSLIVDPWGAVLARVAAGEGVAGARLDRDLQRQVRARMPVLEHRVPSVYRSLTSARRATP